MFLSDLEMKLIVAQTCKEFPAVLRNPKFHCCLRKPPPGDHSVNHSELLPSDFLNKMLYAYVATLMNCILHLLLKHFTVVCCCCIKSLENFTYSMEQSPSWDANRFSASTEIPRILWIPQIHYRVYKCPPPIPFLNQKIQSMPPSPTSWRSILLL